MNIEKFGRLEKEIDKLLQIIDKLQEENGILKKQYQDLINSHKKDQEVIKTLKKEDINHSVASEDTELDKTKEAQIKEGLEKILIKLDNLL